MKIDRKVVFFIFLFLLMSIISVNGYNPIKYKAIHINNTGGSELIYCQISLNVTYDSDMQTDFDDLRVKYYNGDEWVFVPYWIEDKVDGEWCKLWFNATYIPANSWCNNSYRLYYGDPSVSSTNDGDTTFEFFDDFESSLDWTNKWQSNNHALYSTENGVLKLLNSGLTYSDCLNSQNQFSDGFAIEARVKTVGSKPCETYLNFEPSPALMNHKDYVHFRIQDRIITSIGGNDEYTTTDYSVSGVWYRAILKIPSSGGATAAAYEGDTLLVSKTGIPTNRAGYIALFQRPSSTGYVDWIFVRKYSDPEPSVQLGEEQSVCTPPTISSLTNSTPGTTSVTISWTTDQSTDNRVRYSKNSDLSNYSWSSWDNDTTSVSITLTGLYPNTVYYYQAWSYNGTYSNCYTTEPSSQPYKSFTTLNLSGIEPLYIDIEEVGEEYVKINASWIGFDAFETGHYFVFCGMSYGDVKSKKANGDGKLIVEETLYGLFVEGKEYCCKAAAYRGNSSTDSVYTDEACFIAVANETLKQTNYGKYMDDLTDISTELNVTLWASILSEPYKERMGISFFGILFILPFIAMWIRGTNTIIPSILGMILGGFIWAYMPEKFVHMAYLFIIISIAGVIYGIFRQKV